MAFYVKVNGFLSGPNLLKRTRHAYLGNHTGMRSREKKSGPEMNVIGRWWGPAGPVGKRVRGIKTLQRYGTKDLLKRELRSCNKVDICRWSLKCLGILVVTGTKSLPMKD